MGSSIEILALPPASSPILTSGATLITTDSASQDLGGTQTLIPGGPAITVSSTSISLATSASELVGGSTDMLTSQATSQGFGRYHYERSVWRTWYTLDLSRGHVGIIYRLWCEGRTALVIYSMSKLSCFDYGSIMQQPITKGRHSCPFYFVDVRLDSFFFYFH